MDDAAERLIKAMKETAAARFIAASRLQEHDKRLTRLTAFTSAYIIALTILPYFVKMPTHITDLYNLITVALAVVILVASLLEYSSGDWPAPGSEDTRFGVTMGPEVDHGASEVYAGVQA